MSDSQIECEFCDEHAVLTNCKFVVDDFTEYAAITVVVGPYDLCRKCFDQYDGSSLGTDAPVKNAEEASNGASN